MLKKEAPGLEKKLFISKEKIKFGLKILGFEC